MHPGKVVSSVIVRVVDTGRGRRAIVVHDLLRREVREFRTWEEAVAHMRRHAEERGVR
ncbi:MAG TPA: hypothetical protein VFF08_10760 [Trueperaceae bacterium]|nr:hypothetical protein [Trueperaceae bacterium]